MIVKRQEIEKQIYQDWSSKKPQSDICVSILDYLIRNKSKPLSHITYGSLKKIIHTNYSNQDILSAIQYLCGDRIKLLEAKFELIDNEEYYDIPNDELNEARKTGELLHPKTGEQINDYEDKVFKYFQIK